MLGVVFTSNKIGFPFGFIPKSMPYSLQGKWDAITSEAKIEIFLEMLLFYFSLYYPSSYNLIIIHQSVLLENHDLNSQSHDLHMQFFRKYHRLSIFLLDFEHEHE